MVLNDAVLDDRYRTVLAQVRVSIALFGFAMGGPAGVADTASTWSAFSIDARLQVDQLAFCFQTAELTRCIHRGNSG